MDLSFVADVCGCRFGGASTWEHERGDRERTLHRSRFRYIIGLIADSEGSVSWRDTFAELVLMVNAEHQCGICIRRDWSLQSDVS